MLPVRARCVHGNSSVAMYEYDSFFSLRQVLSPYASCSLVPLHLCSPGARQKCDTQTARSKPSAPVLSPCKALHLIWHVAAIHMQLPRSDVQLSMCASYGLPRSVSPVLLSSTSLRRPFASWQCVTLFMRSTRRDVGFCSKSRACPAEPSRYNGNIIALSHWGRKSPCES